MKIYQLLQQYLQIICTLADFVLPTGPIQYIPTIGQPALSVRPECFLIEIGFISVVGPWFHILSTGCCMPWSSKNVVLALENLKWAKILRLKFYPTAKLCSFYRDKTANSGFATAGLRRRLQPQRFSSSILSMDCFPQLLSYVFPYGKKVYFGQNGGEI